MFETQRERPLRKGAPSRGHDVASRAAHRAACRLFVAQSGTLGEQAFQFVGGECASQSGKRLVMRSSLVDFARVAACGDYGARTAKRAGSIRGTAKVERQQREMIEVQVRPSAPLQQRDCFARNLLRLAELAGAYQGRAQIAVRRSVVVQKRARSAAQRR